MFWPAQAVLTFASVCMTLSRASVSMPPGAMSSHVCVGASVTRGQELARLYQCWQGTVGATVMRGTAESMRKFVLSFLAHCCHCRDRRSTAWQDCDEECKVVCVTVFAECTEGCAARLVAREDVFEECRTNILWGFFLWTANQPPVCISVGSSFGNTAWLCC